MAYVKVLSTLFLQVEFSPTLQTLASVVNDIGNHLFSTISVFRHLPEILIKRKFHRDPIHTIVGECKGIRGLGIGGARRRDQRYFQMYWASHLMTGEKRRSRG